MNDLDILRTLRSDTPPASQEVLAHARSRLLDSKAARSRWFPPRVRAGWQTAAAATIVIVLGVGAIVSTYQRAGGPDNRANASPSPSPSDTVQSVLARAAQTVAQAPPAVPATEGQYWYIKEVIRRPGLADNADEMTAEFWFRALEGTGALGRVHFEYEAGFVKDVVRRGGETVVTENGHVVEYPSQPVPGFADDPDPSARWMRDEVAAAAPTIATDMVDFLRGQLPEPLQAVGAVGTDELADLLTQDLVGLLSQPILNPQQRAAGYAALGLLAEEGADIRLEPDVVDATGRHGVGIVFDRGRTMILDRDSYEVLGFEHAGEAEAVVEQGVVDSVDERP